MAQSTALDRPWLDTTLSPDERAALLDAALSEDERYGLLHSRWAVSALPGSDPIEGAIPGAGFVPPIDRLGVPGLYETDASLGVTNPRNCRPGDSATALPSGLALAATWNAELAYNGGAAIGDEAAKKGFNVLLAGGVNLTRDPRCGRNFEYLGEDPLLAGILCGESIRGIQSNGIVATAKHFVLNDQETGRHVVNATIDMAALRESDLLAFEIALERGQPGSVMTAYNKINGEYACENAELLSGVLKGDWSFPGWVMSDWGATTSVEAAAAGLDQQSGEQLDYKVWFDLPLRNAVASGTIPAARVSDMARRILRSMFAAGLFDRRLPTGEPIDTAAHAALAQTAAEQAIVLLKNNGVLPIAATASTILVVGGHSDVGVLAGGGSSQVMAEGGHAAQTHVGGEGAMMAFATEAYHPSSPFRAIRSLARERASADHPVTVRFVNGRYPSEAAALARTADVVILFATQWTTEGMDVPDLSLPLGQDQLIAAVAAANPATVVVLETGGPVAMPWLDAVGAILAAWYPGMRGGEAIARIVFGEVNPSGRLPITFPASVDQLPRPELPGTGGRWLGPAGSRTDLSQAPDFEAPHPEGADTGYRWFARHRRTPLFAFGHGLGYSHFSHSDLTLTPGEPLTASLTVTNTGDRDGADIIQLYLASAAGEPRRRLLGWRRVELAAGETQRIAITADDRVLSTWDARAGGWKRISGAIEVAIGVTALDLTLRAIVEL